MLTAKDGYVFVVGANAFIHSGAAGYPSNMAGSGKTLEITIFFPITGKETVDVGVEW
jgi:hypothetical protein